MEILKHAISAIEYHSITKNKRKLIEFELETKLPCMYNLFDIISKDDKENLDFFWKNKKYENINRLLDFYQIPNDCKCLITCFSSITKSNKRISLNRFCFNNDYSICIEFNKKIDIFYNKNISQRCITDPEKFIDKLIEISEAERFRNLISYGTIYLYKRKKID